MITILLVGLISSLASFGFHIVTRDGFLLGFVERFWNYFIEDRAGEAEASLKPPRARWLEFLAKPISECPPCMGSLWGLAIAGLFYLPLEQAILNCLITVTLNTFLSNHLNF